MASLDNDGEPAASVCPVCLWRPSDAAVLPCVHFFCERCAFSWFVAMGKRPCPLCKVPAQALLTRISADGRAFNERRLGTGPRRPSRWEAVAAAGEEGGARSAAEAAALALAAAARAAVAHARLLPAPHRAAGHRPAALPDCGGDGGKEPADPADRRAFYCASSPPPPPVSPAADTRPRSAIAASVAAAPRVRQFARRDLRALLLVGEQDGGGSGGDEGAEAEDDDDETIALLLEHALGLLRAHGPAPSADAAADNDGDGANDDDADRAAIASLQPLLFEHAPRFWAELSAFARSGLSVEAFDRLRRRDSSGRRGS